MVIIYSTNAAQFNLVKLFTSAQREPCFARLLTGAELTLMVFRRPHPALNQNIWLCDITQAAELYLSCHVTYSNHRAGQLPPQSHFMLLGVNVQWLYSVD